MPTATRVAAHLDATADSESLQSLQSSKLSEVQVAWAEHQGRSAIRPNARFHRPCADLPDANSRSQGRRRPFRRPPIIGEHGKEQVLHGREMRWIRIDRYFRGEPDEAVAVHQPARQPTGLSSSPWRRR